MLDAESHLYDECNASGNDEEENDDGCKQVSLKGSGSGLLGDVGVTKVLNKIVEEKVDVEEWGRSKASKGNSAV